jgi:hypothetical protein
MIMIQLYYEDFIKIFHFEIDHTLNNMGDLLGKILDILNILNIDCFSYESILVYNKHHDLIDFESNYLLIDNDYFDVVIDTENIYSYDPEINVDGDQPWD